VPSIFNTARAIEVLRSAPPQHAARAPCRVRSVMPAIFYFRAAPSADILLDQPSTFSSLCFPARLSRAMPRHTRGAKRHARRRFLLFEFAALIFAAAAFAPLLLFRPPDYFHGARRHSSAAPLLSCARVFFSLRLLPYMPPPFARFMLRAAAQPCFALMRFAVDVDAFALLTPPSDYPSCPSSSSSAMRRLPTPSAPRVVCLTRHPKMRRASRAPR